MPKKISTPLGTILLTVSLIISLFLITSSARQLDILETAYRDFTPRSQLAQISGSGSGLVAHYTFDEWSGTTAGDSAGSNIGTLVNGPTWVTGKVGNGALQFDGTNDYVDVLGLNGSGISTPSLSFWFKTTDGTRGAIFAWGAVTCRIGGNGTGRLNCYSSNSSSGSATSAVNIGDGNWHHAVYVASASGQTLYIDGVQSGTASQSFISPTTVARIGRFLGGSTGYFVGTLDDVRAYNRALTLSEISELYALGGTSVPPNPTDPSDTTAPIITTTPSASSITSTGASVTWTTDESATSQVQYGPTSSYTSNTTETSSRQTSHSVILSSLTSNTTYHYRVTSKDLANNSVISNDGTFMTSAVINQNPLIIPRLTVGDPARLWYGGPNDQLGYDILNLALDQEVNMTDRVKVEWSADGVTWSTNTNTYTPDITISVPALPYNIKQYYRIRAVNGLQLSDYSNILQIVSLYPPSGLTAVAKSRSSVYLTWDYRGAKDRNGQEYELLPGSGYKVERSTNATFPAGSTKTYTVSQPYTRIVNPNNAAKQLVTFTDNDTFSDQTYYYRVRPFTSLGDGETSKIVSLAPNILPEQVSYSAAYTTAESTNAKSSNRVAVTFSTITTGQTGYRIDRSDDASQWTTLKEYGLAIPANPYFDSGLTPGKTYYYRVVAFNDVGDSPYKLLKVQVPNIPSIVTTQWYVDNKNISGNNDGTSWANAWRDVSDINWFAIKPGDTLYIDGGSSGQVYDKPLYVMKGGIEGNPLTIRVGSDSGHTGKATFTQGIIMRVPWVTLDGAKNQNFTFNSLENIDSNQNIEVSNPNDNSCVYSSAPEGTRLLWLNLHDCGLSNGPATIGGNTAAIVLNGNSGISFRAAEIAHVHVRDIWGSGFAVSGPATQYRTATIHHNIVERVRNDFMIGSGGLDIYNNIGRNWIGPGIGHPDAVQIWAPYTRIYNNIFYDTPGTLIYIQLQSVSSNDVQIFNNVMYPNSIVENSAITFTTIANNVTLSNVLIANNLVYNLNKGQLTLNIQPNISPLSVRNMIVKNNLFYLPTNPSNSGNLVDFRSFNYSSNDIVYDYNIIAGSGSLGIGYAGSSYSTPEIFNTAFPQYSHNSSARPAMVNPSSFDFRLTSTDTAARNKGDNLSALCTPAYGWTSTNCPLLTDIVGNARGAEGAWDIGAYEYCTSNCTTVIPPITPPVTPTDSDSDGIPDSTDLCPLTPTAMRTFVNTYGCPKPKAVNFTIKPDFDSLDLRSVTNLELGTTQGRIIFLDPVVLLKDRTTYKDQLDLDANITITNNRVVINSTNAPELNKRATITLSNLTFTNPKILKDGITCTTCTIYSYSNGTLIFTVPSFSTYEAAEVTTGQATTPVAPLGSVAPGSTSGGALITNSTVTAPCTPSTVTPSSHSFTTSLTTGATGESVRQLQIFLNSRGYTISTTGGGSKGNETTYFGPATTRALASFQAANNITPAVGFFGPLTRAKVNSLNTTASGSTCPPTVIPTISSPSTFTRTLSLGMTGNDVKALQVYLNKKGFVISSTGPGSLGNESTYFGVKTQQALARYQTARGITPAVGLFGPITRARIQTEN